MTIAEAIKELRRHEGLSQQAFGSKHGVSIATVQVYEGGKMPALDQLIVFYEAAERAGRQDLCDVFQPHIESEAKRRRLKRVWSFFSAPQTPFEVLAADAFIRFLRRVMRMQSAEGKALAATILNIIDISPLATPAPEEQGGLGEASRRQEHERLREEGLREGFAYRDEETGLIRWGVPNAQGEAPTGQQTQTRRQRRK